MLSTKSRSLSLFVAALSVPAFGQTIIPGGLIDENTVWTLEGSPYLIDGNVLLAPATLLEIEPGVEVRFLGNDYFIISGRLLAEGNAEAHVSFVPDVPSGQWEALYFTEFATDDSALRYCTFEHGGVTIERFFPLVEHCMFGSGSFVDCDLPPPGPECNAVIRHSVFTDSTISFRSEGSLTFQSNTVQGPALGTALYFDYAQQVVVMDNLIVCPGGSALYGEGHGYGTDGTISGNVFVGRDSVVERFLGQVSRNYFSLKWLYALAAGGEWFENNFQFQFPSGGAGGIRLPEPVSSFTLHDNNITATGEPGPQDYLLYTQSGPGLVIDAEMNWWGTDDAAVIEDLIYHFQDDEPQSPYVDFVPFRTAPMPVVDQVTSLQTHGGAGEMGLGIYEWGPSVNIEPRLTGVSKLAVTVAGTLDEITATDPANVLIIGSNTGVYSGAVTLSLDGTGSVLTIEVSPPLADQDCFTVDLTGITSTDGADLLNPTFTVRTLAGDVSRDGEVTVSDKSLIKPKIGQPVDSQNFYFDVSCDGEISVSDKALVKPKIGNTALPCP
ncbi:MAG: dockerin type I domain-containing protein [Planctomycetota bacterium]|jgi:hypothetical protein